MLLRPDHSLAGVYALDALDSDREQDRFERHLRRCHSCTSDVRGFRETATRLGLAAARQPPPGMRDQVMAAVARTRQISATEEHARHARPARRQPLRRLAWAGAALALAAIVVLAVVLVNTQRQLSQTRSQLSHAQQAITAVQTAPDARTLARRTSVGGTVIVVSSASRRQLVVSTSGLPRLAAGKVYQLWLIGAKPNPIRSEGLLAAPRNGRTGPELISGVLAGDTFGVTIEPAGGTAQPTVAPIVGIKLPS
jgi:Anti-sigma-K factor rskA